jgi:hypothetical protein
MHNSYQPRTPESQETQKEYAPRPTESVSYETSSELHWEAPARIEGKQERNQERRNEQLPQEQTETPDSLLTRLFSVRKKPQAPVAYINDDVTKHIETIMAEGLKEVFAELTPVQQQEFKIKGEETAREIRLLMESKKLNLKRVFRLVFTWLKYLPGINSFFLEQEAKIKADKIIAAQKHYFHDFHL